MGTPAGPWLQSALSGSPVEPHSILDKGGLLGLSILLVALGLGSGWALYGRRPRGEAEAPDPLERAYPRLFGFLAARLKIDEFYAATFGRLARGLGALAVGLDQSVWAEASAWSLAWANWPAA